MKKKIILLAISIISIAVFFTLSSKVKATEDYDYELTFYAVDSELLNEFPELTIPSNYLQKYKLTINGKTLTARKCYRTDSYSTYIVSDFEIDSEGYLKPVPSTVYYLSGGSKQEYIFGESTFFFYNEGKKYNVKAKVINYATTYVDKQLQNWVNTNLKGKSELDKAKTIVKYVADNTDYSYKYQSYVSMYLYKCGDCWASTNTIVKLSELAGLKCQARNGNNDPGAGSGHENNIFLIEGKYYIADAGYNETKPRYYYFSEKSSPYIYTTLSDGTIKLLQYDGFDTTLTIPSTIDGKTVTTIGDNFLSNTAVLPEKITLPNTITTIGDASFYTSRESNLKSINIPASVTKIGMAPFSNCSKLTIDISKNNNFVIENNVLYNKDKTELIQVLKTYNGNKTFEIPWTVKNIYRSAFFNIENIEKVIIPASLTDIGEGAFYNSYIKEITIPKTVKSIGYAAFHSSKLQTVIFENNATTTIGEGAFYNNYWLERIIIPKTITSFGNKAFASIGNKAVMYGESESKAQSYANENKITFKEIAFTPFIDVAKGKWYANAVKYTYENNIISGYNSYTFAPDDKLTRGMLVTILWRMEGSPSNNGKSRFPDVETNKYYSNAIKWASDNGVVNGYKNGNFGPKDNITRQDLAGILRNYAIYKKKNVNKAANLTKYSDYKTISNYATTSMSWAVATGVISGNKNGTLTPKGNATRAEAAGMIYNYCTNVGR